MMSTSMSANGGGGESIISVSSTKSSTIIIITRMLRRGCLSRRLRIYLRSIETSFSAWILAIPNNAQQQRPRTLAIIIAIIITHLGESLTQIRIPIINIISNITTMIIIIIIILPLPLLPQPQVRHPPQFHKSTNLLSDRGGDTTTTATTRLRVHHQRGPCPFCLRLLLQSRARRSLPPSHTSLHPHRHLHRHGTR